MDVIFKLSKYLLERKYHEYLERRQRLTRTLYSPWYFMTWETFISQGYFHLHEFVERRQRSNWQHDWSLAYHVVDHLINLYFGILLFEWFIIQRIISLHYIQMSLLWWIITWWHMTLPLVIVFLLWWILIWWLWLHHLLWYFSYGRFLFGDYGFTIYYGISLIVDSYLVITVSPFIMVFLLWWILI